MSELDILKQLSDLKNIKPDQAWKAAKREFLRKQIETAAPGQTAAARPSGFFAWLRWPVMALRSVSQPALAVTLIALFMVSSGIASLKASRDTNPGDSLYIAKIISEKTQLALTFNEKEKARLGIEFAGNRANEYSRLLAADNGLNDERMEKLVNDFKKEIDTVKSRLERISLKTGPAVTHAPGDDESAAPGEEPAAAAGSGEDGVFSANASRDDSGISIHIPQSGEVEVLTPPEPEPVLPAEAATTTPEAATTTPSEEVKPAASTQDLLKEAEQSLAEDNYDNTILKLNEAVDAIINTDKGEVKGESEGEGTETEAEADTATNAGAVTDEEGGAVSGDTATGTVPKTEAFKATTTGN